MRIELSGGLYHVAARGEPPDDIEFDDEDRLAWQDILYARMSSCTNAYMPY